MYTFWEFESNGDSIYPFFDNHCFLSLISIFGTKRFIVKLSKRIIFEGVVLLNCRKKQSAIYSVCMEHPHMTLKCCSAVSRALTFSFNWMILWKVTINVSKNLRGECYPKDQIKRDSLVMLKRTDYVINLLVNLVSNYSELKTLLARPAQLIIKASISFQTYHSFNVINVCNFGRNTWKITNEWPKAENENRMIDWLLIITGYH